MKSGLFKLVFLAIVASFTFFVSCGDDDSSNNTDNSNYIQAKITGNYVNNSLSVSSISGAITNGVVQVVIVDTESKYGVMTLRFPSGVTGSHAIDGTSYIALFTEPSLTTNTTYTAVSGTINLEVNNSSKVKGTFEFNGKIYDGSKSIVVSNGKFQYNFN